MNNMQSLHSEIYGTLPDISVKVPGRLFVMGEHTEYFEGEIISLAIGRYLQVSLSGRQDNSLRFYSELFGERKKASLSGLKYKREDRWANYIKGAIAVLLQLGCPVKGLDIAIHSTIPIQVGLGSSTALCLGVLEAIRQFYNFEISDLQLIESARLSELKFMNRDPGLVSATVCLLGREGTLAHIDSKTMAINYLTWAPRPFLFLLTESNVPNGDGQEEIEELNQEFADLKEYLQNNQKGLQLREFPIQKLKALVAPMSEGQRRRCSHILSEMNRVKEFLQALEEQDMLTIGKLLTRSHESLRDQLEISCPEIDWLVKRANETEGIEGARIVGSGFGGCTLNLINDNSIKDYEIHLEEYDRIFGFTANYFACTPIDGLKKIN